MFAVLTRIGSTWSNVWGVEDESGVRQPLVFASREEAKEEIQDHLDTCQAQGMEAVRADYKVVKVDSPTDHWEP